MDVYEQKVGGRVTLTVDGRLDAGTAQSLERYYERLKGGIETLTLDFSLLKYLSSAGIRIIIMMLKDLNSRGKKFSIINIPDNIRSVFKTAGIVKLFVRDEGFVIVQKSVTHECAEFSLAGEMDSKGMAKVESLINSAAFKDCAEVVLDCEKVPMITVDAQKMLDELQTVWSEEGRKLTVRFEAPTPPKTEMPLPAATPVFQLKPAESQ